MKKKVKGIGGWLILPTIGLFIGAFVWLIAFFLYGYISLFEGFSKIDLAYFLSATIMSFLTIYSLILEFKHKKEFPMWAIYTMWAGVFVTIFLSILDGDYSDLFATLAGTILWSWYFSVSIRVKNTFVK